MVDLSVIIVNWNTRDLLIQCLRSIHDTVPPLSFEVIVVDNASTDDSVAATRARFPSVKILENQENVGFAKANNQATRISQGRALLLFNSDAILLPHAAQALYDVMQANPRAGIVGAQLLNADGSFQASHTPFPNLWQEFLILSGLGRLMFGRWYPSHGPEEEQGPHVVDYVEGACLLVRRSAGEDVGEMDEGYFMYAEEVDWCYTMRARGWQVWYQPAAWVIHLGGGSSQNRRPQRESDLYKSRVRFFRRHYGGLAAGALKLQILALTGIKTVAHGLLRLASGNRVGRQVVPLGRLAAELWEA